MQIKIPLALNLTYRDIKAEQWLYSVWQRYRCEQCSYSLTKKNKKKEKRIKIKCLLPRQQWSFIKNKQTGSLGVRPANSWGDDRGGDTEQEQKCLQQKVFVKNKPGTALAGFRRCSTRKRECALHIIKHRRVFITYNTAKNRSLAAFPVKRPDEIYKDQGRSLCLRMIHNMHTETWG